MGVTTMIKRLGRLPKARGPGKYHEADRLETEILEYTLASTFQRRVSIAR